MKHTMVVWMCTDQQAARMGMTIYDLLGFYNTFCDLMQGL